MGLKDAGRVMVNQTECQHCHAPELVSLAQEIANQNPHTKQRAKSHACPDQLQVMKTLFAFGSKVLTQQTKEAR